MFESLNSDNVSYLDIPKLKELEIKENGFIINTPYSKIVYVKTDKKHKIDQKDYHQNILLETLKQFPFVQQTEINQKTIVEPKDNSFFITYQNQKGV
jgi:hypothetical protein